MKKSVLFVLMAVLSVTAFAQVSWNAKVGMNLSNFTGDAETDPKVGFKIGGGMEYAFSEVWLLQPSLLFSTKGASLKEGDGSTNAMYVEMPVMAAARVNVADNTNLVFSAGPYVAYGVGGKHKLGNFKSDTFGDNGFDRFDAGLGFGVAAEFGKIVVGLDGQTGLVKLTEGSNAKNINFSLTLGYKF